MKSARLKDGGFNLTYGNKMTPAEGIDATVDQVAKTLKAVSNKADNDIIINDIKDALTISKEINANDKVDRNRNRANEYLKKARTAVKNGDLIKATEELKEAKNRFSELKTMLNLTQADRAAQQTHMLDR
jgi:molybdopterin converting factor small subunit